jgi:hypothetical protein
VKNWCFQSLLSNATCTATTRCRRSGASSASSAPRWGLYTSNAVCPIALEAAWVQPLDVYKLKTWFHQSLLFECANVYRYASVGLLKTALAVGLYKLNAVHP